MKLYAIRHTPSGTLLSMFITTGRFGCDVDYTAELQSNPQASLTPWVTHKAKSAYDALKRHDPLESDDEYPFMRKKLAQECEVVCLEVTVKDI